MTCIVVIEEGAVYRLVPLANVRALTPVDIDAQRISDGELVHGFTACCL
jgi:hypothetical protein